MFIRLIDLSIQISTVPVDQNQYRDITSAVITRDTIIDSSTIVDETVEDVVSNINDQTASYQNKEQISTAQKTESYLQDQIQDEQAIGFQAILPQVRINFIKFKFFFII